MDTTVTDPLVGRLVDGRYRVGARLARGGMAVVYQAVDARLDRTVALKVMHPGLAEDEEFVSRFIREAKSAARLSHPNVVAVYDQGADDGHVFLAMEHVAGRTLRDLLRDRGWLTPRQALDVLEPVLAALGAAHQAGLVHRDVKPENVLLADDGRVKVADFGLARAVSSSTSHTTSGILMGTVGYLSPEQVERGAADARSDVYAAGILLFEMLTGVKPYDGDSAIQVAYRHVHDDVPAPSTVRPGVPAELDALVVHATSRNPDLRPADARRFLTDVVRARRDLSDGELDADPRAAHTLVVPLEGPAAAPAKPRSGRSAREPDAQAPPARRRRRGLLVLLLVLALAAGLSGAAWYYAEGPGSFVRTPSLLKLSVAEAKTKAAERGLSVRVDGRGFDEVIPAGHVLRTDPRQGQDITQNGVINLTLSKGPERYEVPEVAGARAAEARGLLETQHLSVGTPEREFSRTVAKGLVIRSNPAAGTPLKRDTAVTLVISRGRPPVEVPDVTEQSLDQARAVLEDAQLRSKVVDEKYDKDVPEGAVISQSPQGGTTPENSVVSLVVSKGPPLVDVPDVVGKPINEAS
ncbi:MAG: Stk1 family PASTA domain-containing Ser/Thr kinase, partial [Propionibacteriales bacterium]|nr:Stk1 family PASTA domain-containing Ser/Thr kinase [Propionibacteriales bacterium]